MELILWRHADAEDNNPQGDLARRLTKKGRKQAELMARWLQPRVGADWRLVCSPAQRALETVEPLGREFEVREAVSTSASAQSVLRAVEWPDGRDTLVIGHQPTLGEVAALLLGGEAGEVSVRKGAILWFATRGREGHAETLLKAVLDPETLEE